MPQSSTDYSTRDHQVRLQFHWQTVLARSGHGTASPEVQTPNPPIGANQNRPLELAVMVNISMLSADSAGAYWSWSRASTYADAEPVNVRAYNPAPGVHQLYYTSEDMGHVAATVNVGHPSAGYRCINGIQARFQAYDTCEAVLFDTPCFNDAHGKPQPTPEGYEPRRQ